MSTIESPKKITAGNVASFIAASVVLRKRAKTETENHQKSLNEGDCIVSLGFFGYFEL